MGKQKSTYKFETCRVSVRALVSWHCTWSLFNDYLVGVGCVRIDRGGGCPKSPLFQREATSETIDMKTLFYKGFALLVTF